MTYPVQAVAAVTGQPIARVDGRLKVTGSARYASDNPAPNLLYATLVCSTVSRGTVAGVDSSAARSERDVVRVFDRFPGVHLPYDPAAVAFFGQPVAVVAARTMEAAMHGASLVTVRYAQAPQVTDIDSPHGRSAARTTPDRLRARRSRRRSRQGARGLGPAATRSPVTTTTRWNCPRPWPAGTATS